MGSYKVRKLGLLFITLMLFNILATKVFADCEGILEDSVGWTIVDSKTIEGWRDSGKDKEDAFEGCDYGRVIYFTDGTTARCNSYGYQYAYRPTAIILGLSSSYQGKQFTSFKMIVECEEYDLQ